MFAIHVNINNGTVTSASRGAHPSNRFLSKEQQRETAQGQQEPCVHSRRRLSESSSLLGNHYNTRNQGNLQSWSLTPAPSCCMYNCIRIRLEFLKCNTQRPPHLSATASPHCHRDKCKANDIHVLLEGGREDWSKGEGGGSEANRNTKMLCWVSPPSRF